MEFLPEPHPQFHALAVLKSKLGELDALSKMTDRDCATIQPMVEVLSNVTTDRGRLLPKIATTAVTLARHGRALMIDVSQLDSSSELWTYPGGPFGVVDRAIQSAFEQAFHLFSSQAPPMIPAIRSDGTDTTLREVALIREADDRDVAVRIVHPWRQTETILDELRRVSTALRITAENTHVIVDVGYIDRINGDAVRGLDALIHRIQHDLTPRSTTVLSGSTPVMRTALKPGLRARLEHDLWVLCVECSDGDPRPIYGDYGVVHPVAPLRDPSALPALPNPYIFYTLANESLYLFRKLPRQGAARPPHGAAAEHFADLSRELTTRAEYRGSDFSWGDFRLKQSARGNKDGLGSSSAWIAIATSHHLAQLRRETDAA